MKLSPALNSCNSFAKRLKKNVSAVDLTSNPENVGSQLRLVIFCVYAREVQNKARLKADYMLSTKFKAEEYGGKYSIRTPVH